MMQQTFSQCNELKISINRFQTDACCYEKATIEYLESLPEKVQYYIRAEMNEGLRIALEDETGWNDSLILRSGVLKCLWIRQFWYGRFLCCHVPANDR